MKTTLQKAELDALLDGPLAAANRRFAQDFPGESDARQPLHTVYGGAHLFTAEVPKKLGQLALRMLRDYAPDAAVFAHALELPGFESIPTPGASRDALMKRLAADPEGVRRENRGAWLAHRVYERVVAKLEREPVEDFRIDFEDGFGNRLDAEEDATAERAAHEVARGLKDGLLPPFLGIRIKPLNDELKRRSARTLDIFMSTLLAETAGALPQNFVVTLPKVPVPEQVTALVAMFERLEAKHGIVAGTMKLELMIELTQSVLDREGRANLPILLAAARGRCTGAHVGTYDYTASCSITAQHQLMDHPACDFLKNMMKVAYANTGIFLSDGATNVMPTPVHRGENLTAEQRAENARAVHHAWKMAYDNIRHSLVGAYYQGWDLHPGQLPIRYAACFAFFLDGLDAASARLKNFIEKAGQATLVGNVFDDAATGQGLLNFFLRAQSGGAIDMTEVAATGLTLEEIQTRSFVKILDGRKVVH